MNWILLFSIAVVVCGAISAIFANVDRKFLSTVFSIITAAFGVGCILMQKGDKSSDIPFIAVHKQNKIEQLFADSIALEINNPDTLLPFRDVTIRISNNKDVVIGTFYPEGNKIFYMIPMPEQDSLLPIDVYYNGTEKYSVQVKLKKISDLKLEASYSYMAGKVKFTPTWKRKHESFDTLSRLSLRKEIERMVKNSMIGL